MIPLALEAVGVSKRYGDRDALYDVDLAVRPGELHGLLGPNGAGKTTLMRVLLGLVRPDVGTVHLLGRRVESADRRVPDGVAGFVETPAFYPYLSGRKNLALLARLDGEGRNVSAVGVNDALDAVGLSAQADQLAGGYSAGMRQRLGLAAALMRSPRLLFLDEPTSSLDPAGARDVRALARRLADAGAAVVLSSHDMSEVEELCATLTFINQGCVVFSGTIGAVRALAPPRVHALHTSDDRAALGLARLRPGISAAAVAGGGLEVSGHSDALDEYVIALGCAGIAVRALESRTRSLESLFFQITGNADAVEVTTARAEATLGARVPVVMS
ncbi:MAG TPA: ABC transporter ATP-binding protein [Vicinamibacterales bacterium]|nr:ABC transporter ATP-binding protein [Vicinamibacterales bacterium]